MVEPALGAYIAASMLMVIGRLFLAGRRTYRRPARVRRVEYLFSRFDDLTVPQLLFAWSAAGIAINPPRQTSLIDIDGQATVENQYSRFTLVVVDGGLGENGTLFWSPGGTRAHRQPLSHGNIHHRTARYWLAQRVSAVIALPTFRNRLPARNRAAVSWDSRGDDL